MMQLKAAALIKLNENIQFVKDSCKVTWRIYWSCFFLHKMFKFKNTLFDKTLAREHTLYKKIFFSILGPKQTMLVCILARPFEHLFRFFPHKLIEQSTFVMSFSNFAITPNILINNCYGIYDIRNGLFHLHLC